MHYHGWLQTLKPVTYIVQAKIGNISSLVDETLTIFRACVHTMKLIIQDTDNLESTHLGELEKQVLEPFICHSL